MKRRGDSEGEKVSLERRLGYIFLGKNLLEEALTHTSFANEYNLPYHNERLEYLGDAVLELCVSEILFTSNPDFSEGRLTKERSFIVREATLARWAESLGIQDAIRLGKGMEMQGGRKNHSILADAMEAVIGAAFVDGDYSAARQIVNRLIKNDTQSPIERHVEPNDEKDAKSRLQEALQALGGKPPSYTLKRRTGPDHASIFEVEAKLADGTIISTGRGNSIKSAEFAAAEAALEELENDRRP